MKSTALVVPSFVVIGTMKGGTRSLHNYLRAHPEVVMTKMKECNYFIPSPKGEHGRGYAWYQSLFEKEGKAYGDVSPNYSKRHQGPIKETARLLYEANPDVKIIYLVRDPIARFLSHYVHALAKGKMRHLSPSEVVRRPKSNLFLTSCYHYQLEPYLAHFPLEQFSFVVSEELRGNTDATLQRIFSFIGVRPFSSEIFNEVYHASAGKTRPSLLEKRIESQTLRKVLEPVLPKSLSERRPIEKPQLSDEDRAVLAERFAPDVAKLRALTGLSFDQWSV